ncbi:hypothetical protein JHK85_025348 [Glycine max]|nr:hypothetical protein JHK85_025348 [Glycine max]
MGCTDLVLIWSKGLCGGGGGKGGRKRDDGSAKGPLSYRWIIHQEILLVGAQVSLTSLHSVIAFALFTSLLSLHNTNWGCLSEDKTQCTELHSSHSAHFGTRALEAAKRNLQRPELEAGAGLRA